MENQNTKKTNQHLNSQPIINQVEKNKINYSLIS
jgi:hypothetical protein